MNNIKINVSNITISANIITLNVNSFTINVYNLTINVNNKVNISAGTSITSIYLALLQAITCSA